MGTFSFTNIKRLVSGVAMAALVIAPVACDDDDDDTPTRATANVVAPVTASNFDALDGATLTFPASAGAVLAPSLAGQSLTMAFVSTGTARTATITPSGGGTIVANVTFGSCIFTITEVTNVTGLSVGQQITIPNCNITVGTNGVATGANANVPLTVTIGGTTSNPITVVVTVSSGGQVTVTAPSGKTVNAGTVGTGPITGTITGS